MSQGPQKENAFTKVKSLREQLKAAMSEISSTTIDIGEKGKITVKIGEKGTLNMYGFGRMPICLYFSQLVRFQKLLNSPEFQKFVTENQEKLAKKEV